MKGIQNILCACIGNKDRSPIVAAFLAQMLKNQGCDMSTITIESAGVSQTAKAGAPAPELAVNSAKTFGLNTSNHRQRYAGNLDMAKYDLAIAADFTAQLGLVELGFKGEIICLNLEGKDNAWMSQNQRKVDDMVVSIMTAVAREVMQYKFANLN